MKNLLFKAKGRALSMSFVGVFVLGTSLLLGGCQNGGTTNETTSTSVYDHVIKAGVIRCGYVAYPPGCIKDPNTGKLSGVFVETLEAAAKNLGLKVEWKEEVGWGTMIEGLQAGRYDLIGSPVWANSTRAKQADFTVPLFYSGIGVYTKVGNNQFAGNLASINNPSVRVSAIDGEMSDIIAQGEFPLAKRVSYPQLSDNSQLMLALTSNKADVTFVEPFIAAQFLKTNPNSVQNIASQKPIRVFPTTMMLKRGEYDFKAMLDVALQEQINSGFVDKLLAKYDPAHTIYHVAAPYSAPTTK